MSSIILALPQEFSYTQTVSCLSQSLNECMHFVENNKIYKLIPVEMEHILVEISCDLEDKLLVRFPLRAAPPKESTCNAVVAYLREWFDLDTDLAAFYTMAEQDLLLSRLIVQFYGLRKIGIPNLFEALCWGILGQQINLAFAYTLKKRFVESFGHDIEWNGHNHWVFPTPQVISQLTVDDLSRLQISTKKAEYIIGVAGQIAEGKLSKKELLAENNFLAVEKKLVSIRGIGPWTANYVLMRCLRYPSAFPIDDVGLQNAIRHLLGADRKPTTAEIKQLAATWTDWESYATLYIWRSLY